MVDYFLNKPNGYVQIARDLFGKDVQEDTPDYRTVKSIVLGTNYGMSPTKLAEDLWVRAGVHLSEDYEEHIRQTEDLYRRYMRLFPRLREYIDACAHEALTTGKVVMALGYERRLPLSPAPPRSERRAWYTWKRLRKHVMNEAANCRAQHLASLITGSAMIDVEERLLQQHGLSYTDYHAALMRREWPSMPLLINEVHDDLVYDVPRERRKENLALIRETMQELPTLRRLLPDLGDIIRVEQKTGPAWGQH